MEDEDNVGRADCTPSLSLSLYLPLSHSPSVCRYPSPAVRLRRRCPPPGTCGGDAGKEQRRQVNGRNRKNV